MMMKFDSAGVIEWSKWYKVNNTGYSEIQAIYQTKDSCYFGVIYYWGYRQVLVKLDKQGNVIWCKWVKPDNSSYENRTGDIFNSPLIEFDNGDIVTHGSWVSSSSYFTPSIFKIDKNGNIIWHRQYDLFNTNTTSYSAASTIKSPDNGFLMVGATNEKTTTSYDKYNMFIIKTDSLGFTGCENVKTLNTVNVDEECEGFDFTDTLKDYPLVMWDVKFNVRDIAPAYEIVCSNVGIDEPLKIKNEELLLYPNPATTTIQIETPTNTGTLQITDINGKVVLTKEIKELKENIDIAVLPQGLYFVRAVTGGGVYNGRFVKML